MPRVPRWPTISTVLLLFALGLGLLATHTDWLTPHGLAVDVEIATDVRTPWLTTVMQAISWIASPPVAAATLAVGCVALVAWRRPVSALATFLVVAVGWCATLLVKAIVARPRPPIDIVHSLQPETGSDSYPSGHTAFAVSAAIAAWFLVRGTRHARRVAALGGAAVVLVGFSRLYLGVHYPGDIVGSILVSTAAIVALTGLWHSPLTDRVLSGPVVGSMLGLVGGASADRARPGSGNGHRPQ